MEELDTEKLARVWSRVRGTTGDDPLQQMLTLTRTAYAHSLFLARMHQGSKRQILQNMARQNRITTQHLQGICVVNGCEYGIFIPRQFPGTIRQQLMAGYQRQLQLASLFESQSADPLFGDLYSRLVQQAKEQSQIFLQLLGARQ